MQHTHTHIQVSHLPEACREALCSHIRKSAMQDAGAFCMDLTIAQTPNASWGASLWRQFFRAAGWTEKEAAALSGGAMPENMDAILEIEEGLFAVLRGMFTNGFKGKHPAIQKAIPSAKKKALHRAVYNLRAAGYLRITERGEFTATPKLMAIKNQD